MAIKANIDGICAPPRLPIRARLAALLGGWRLDRELARGVDPRSRPALTARARSLIAGRHRIADRIDAMAEPASERRGRCLQVPVRRGAIAEARDDLHRLSAALRADDDCRAQGVALASLLLADGGSPLYDIGDPRGPLFGRQRLDRIFPEDLLTAARSAYRALSLATPY